MNRPPINLGTHRYGVDASDLWIDDSDEVLQLAPLRADELLSAEWGDPWTGGEGWAILVELPDPF